MASSKARELEIWPFAGMQRSFSLLGAVLPASGKEGLDSWGGGRENARNRDLGGF